MDKTVIANYPPTSQVRIICEELLSDCQPHSRREMENYIESQIALLGLPRPTHGCMAGGIRNALQRKNCIKLGTAIYQATISSPIEEVPLSRAQRAADCIQTAINTISSLAHEIDYVEADENELIELNKLRNCILSLKDMQSVLKD